MNIIIRADRKIRENIIGNYVFAGKKIIDRFIDFALELKPEGIYIIKDPNLEVKSIKEVKIIPAEKTEEIKNEIILDLDYAYDTRLLKKLIAKKRNLEKAIIIKNEEMANLKAFGGLYIRREWNPISQYYIEPIGEKIACLLRNTKITPNAVTILNIFLSIGASAFLYFGGLWNILLFVLFVRLFHILDVADGHLAKLKCMQSTYGKWIDGGGDKLILNAWIIAAILSIFTRTGSAIYLIIGIFLLFGEYMYNYLSLTATSYYGQNNLNYTIKSDVKQNILVRIFTFFMNGDIKLYMISIFALMNKLDWFLIFYCIHFNLSWLAYVAHYSYDNLKK